MLGTAKHLYKRPPIMQNNINFETDSKELDFYS